MKESLDRKRVGKAALITGSSSGLGKELAILFSQNGHVILSGRNQEKLEATKLLCKDPHNTTLLCGDLSSTETVVRLATFGDLYNLQYLICCAGEYFRGSIEEHMQHDIISMVESNILGHMRLIRAVYSRLTEGSTIVHINSIAGKTTQSEELVYSATKHGMAAFLRGLRFEAREKGIRVLDVFSGAIQTPMNYNREGLNSMMPVKEVAKAIFSVVMTPFEALQVEELHIGRFPQK